MTLNKSVGIIEVLPVFNTSNIRQYRQSETTILRLIIINLPLALYVIAVILHAIGITFLLPYRKKRNQDYIIINMSVSEIGISLLDIVQNIVLRDTRLKSCLSIVITVNCSIFVIPCFMILTILTIDRFLEVRLNIKYLIYCTKRRTIICLVICWVIGFTTGLVLVYLKIAHNTHVLMIIYKYVYPTYESFLLILAIVVYGYIYKKFLEHRRKPFSIGKIGSTIKLQQSCIKRATRKTGKPIKHERSFVYSKARFVLKRKNFFPPFLIMFTFALFVILPDLLNLFYMYIFMHNDVILWTNISLCLYATGFICDAIIYIYLHRHLRNAVIRTFISKFKSVSTLSTDYSSSEMTTKVPKQQTYECLQKYKD